MTQDYSILSEIFKFLDRDNDGILSSEDLRLSLGSLKLSTDDFESDPTGMDVSLFLATINSRTSQRKSQASIRNAFKVLVNNNFTPDSPLIPVDQFQILLLENQSLSQQDFSNFISLSDSISAISSNPSSTNSQSSMLDYEKLITHFS